jgi:hypothetical protein
MELRDNYDDRVVATELVSFESEPVPGRMRYVVRYGTEVSVKRYAEHRKRIVAEKSIAVRYHLWFFRIALYGVTQREMPNVKL